MKCKLCFLVSSAVLGLVLLFAGPRRIVTPTCLAQEAAVRYEAAWPSLDCRPTPSWYAAAKFGIFIHWGVYSVPAWGSKGQYAEWYWKTLENKESETAAFHRRVYGADFKYEQFAPMFRAELFNPNEWADLLARSGARYVVVTSKHHEGFCDVAQRRTPRLERGGYRPASGFARRPYGFGAQARPEGRVLLFALRMAPSALSNRRGTLRQRLYDTSAQGLGRRYRPSLLFADGEWDHDSTTWRTPELLAWLFNEGPNRDEVVVNDRWGKDCRSAHGSYFATEYGEVGKGKALGTGRPWEENRGIGASFGYNRNESAAEYRTDAELIALFGPDGQPGRNLLGHRPAGRRHDSRRHAGAFACYRRLAET